MASKLEDQLPITLEQIIKNVGSNTFPREKILDAEGHIMHELRYKLLLPSPSAFEQSYLLILQYYTYDSSDARYMTPPSHSSLLD